MCLLLPVAQAQTGFHLDLCQLEEKAIESLPMLEGMALVIAEFIRGRHLGFLESILAPDPAHTPEEVAAGLNIL
jgi:hypothetical protein